MYGYRLNQKFNIAPTSDLTHTFLFFGSMIVSIKIYRSLPGSSVNAKYFLPIISKTKSKQIDGLESGAGDSVASNPIVMDKNEKLGDEKGLFYILA